MTMVKKPQKTFIALLLSALVVFQGKATFRNLSRYSPMSEKRFSRWYGRSFDFFTFNCLMLSDLLSKSDELIAALDASFMTKSGKFTDGLGMFWRGCTGRAEKGLELSLLSLVDLKANTAYALDVQHNSWLTFLTSACCTYCITPAMAIMLRAPRVVRRPQYTSVDTVKQHF
ncbi:hypothetical protein [Endozoicomonas sp.]|uniref:hypothetical protein n=1 Tax=Endozoicomonas sp. TaxID=1892382 RepID=UPI00383A89FC